MDSYDRINNIVNAFSRDEIMQIGRKSNQAFSRTRKLPFDKFCMSILAKKGKTLTMELNNFFDDINETDNCISKQDFSKQRCNLNPEVFKVLNTEYVKQIYDSNQYETLKGYLVTAIDGSVTEIPNTQLLQEEYGYIKSSDKEDVKLCARARVSGIFDVINEVMVDSKIDRYNSSERELAKENIEEMLTIFNEKKSITLFDRGYFSIELLYYLEKRGLKYLFRLKKNTYEKERLQMKSEDEMVEIITTGRKVEKVKDIELRKQLRELGKIEVRFVLNKLDTQEEEILITNLGKEEFTTEDIGNLYFKRWGIEKSYDVMKNKLEIENFSGKKPIIIEQDFYSQILVLNMLYDVRRDTNKKIQTTKSHGYKYDYQININILAGLLKNMLIQIFIKEDEEKRQIIHAQFIRRIKRYIEPIRPERKNARNKYLGKNKYRTNKRRAN